MDQAPRVMRAYFPAGPAWRGMGSGKKSSITSNLKPPVVFLT